jgi:hypothetical protein
MFKGGFMVGCFGFLRVDYLATPMGIIKHYDYANDTITRLQLLNTSKYLAGIVIGFL